jgi:PPOX class probable F420-dependent enzyme
MPMKKRAIDELLKQPNVAVIAVTTPDGAPHAVPTWYEYRKGEVSIITDVNTFKCKCLMRDPRVALVVDIRKPPYKAVVLKGSVTMEETVADDLLERMAIAYLGRKAGLKYAAQFKGETVVVMRFKPSRVRSWDYEKEM